MKFSEQSDLFVHVLLFYDSSKIYLASLGLLGVSQGSWEVLGESLGVLGRPFVILWGPRWFLGFPFGVLAGLSGVLRKPQGVLGEEPNGTENTAGSLSV